MAHRSATWRRFVSRSRPHSPSCSSTGSRAARRRSPPPAPRGIEFPDILRQHFEQQPATERAEFEGDGFSVVLYGFEAQPLAAIHAEVRGDGNPVPVLAALCRPHGWVAVDDASGRPVELAGAEASGWEAFRAYRDHAVRTIQASESGPQAGK